MGWSLGWDNSWKRWIGYGVPAYCDSPKCTKEIDRGLAYVCGGEPLGGDHGCGLYFCPEHLRGYSGNRGQLCTRCRNYRDPYTAKPDHPDWIKHQQTDPSWAEWRAEQALSRLP